MSGTTLTVRGTPAPKGSRTLGKRRDGSLFNSGLTGSQPLGAQPLSLSTRSG